MAAAGGASAAGRAAAGNPRQSHPGALIAHPLPDGMKLVEAGSQAPTDAFCRANFDSPCYSPQEIRHAYGVDALINRGDQGKGQTIVIIDSYGSPTIASDLQTFDAGYGLPDPPSFKVLSPLGTVPYDPATYPDEPGWAEESTLDVEWSHAMAPKANIVLLTSPVDETEGTVGMPQFDYLINYALDHHLGNVISQSWGATENGLFDPAGEQVISEFNRSYARAAAMGVTAIASTGDAGTANLENDLSTIYPFPTVNFPAASPLIAAIGGTSLFADTSGDYQSETVWNQGNAATGGGISQQFREPFYQAFLPRSVQQELGGNRGIPDVSWNADPGTSIEIYISVPGIRVVITTSAARVRAPRRGPGSWPTSTSSRDTDWGCSTRTRTRSVTAVMDSTT
jgi:subtilase family serine protease